MSETTGGDAVVAALEALDVRHVFGIVSVHNLPIYDAIRRRGTITPISVRHEQGAAHAADAYARVSGGLGVAITSTGPGAANSMGGLFEAAFASSRVLMITGQIESRFHGKGKGFLHEAERQTDMLRSVTRRTETVRAPDDIADVVLAVGRDILSGRPQPGAVEIPIDFQYAAVAVKAVTSQPPLKLAPAAADLDRAADLLRGSKRPLLWGGGGVLSAGAWEELTQLAERLNAPVVTSIDGRGAIVEDHPLSVSPAPELPAVRQLVGDADVVLAVGTRFQMTTTARWTTSFNGALVHLDADPAVIGRSYEPTVALVGDARVGLAALLERVDEGSADPAFAARGREVREEVRAQLRSQIGADYAAIMDVMRRVLPRDANLVKDATVPAYLWGNRLLEVLEPRTSVRPASAAIGPGLPFAIGAALGNGRRTLLIQGDGGLMLSIGELATAVQYGLPIVMCLFNDKGYGILRWVQEQTFQAQTGVELATPDFVSLAQSVGVVAERVDTVEKFERALERAVESSGPTVVEISMEAFEPMSVVPSAPRSTQR